jgi:hypothetical protein
MKLPDFRLYEPLNRLKAQMGIPRDEYGSISVVVAAGGLTVEELGRLSQEGIDLRWEDLTHISNGTFAYKGNRVLLYIRDVSQYGDQITQPRYHLVTCGKITQMHKAGRGQRYVAATRTDGVFRVNINSPAGQRAEDLRLKVCKLCLTQLDFNSYNRLYGPARQAFVDSFLPEHFFAKYPMSPHKLLPLHDSDGAPLNDYTADFHRISEKARQDAGWRCEGCGADLSAQGLRRFLHVHHRDGNRWDNSPHNLRVLCIGCHAEEPSHGHLRGALDYREYRRLRPIR